MAVRFALVRGLALLSAERRARPHQAQEHKARYKRPSELRVESRRASMAASGAAAAPSPSTPSKQQDEVVDEEEPLLPCCSRLYNANEDDRLEAVQQISVFVSRAHVQRAWSWAVRSVFRDGGADSQARV